jgi:hypothetical protein
VVVTTLGPLVDRTEILQSRCRRLRLCRREEGDKGNAERWYFMEQEKTPEEEGRQEVQSSRTPEQDLELWKSFATSGTGDKNTLVIAASWILGLSAGAFGYIVPQLLKPGSAGFTDPVKVSVLAFLGVVASCTAGYMALVYGGYANRNWEQADRIARFHGWKDLVWDASIGEPRKPPEGGASFWARRARKYSRSRDPMIELAPIFSIYVTLAVVTAAFHAIFLIWSVAVLIKGVHTAC